MKRGEGGRHYIEWFKVTHRLWGLRGRVGVVIIKSETGCLMCVRIGRFKEMTCSRVAKRGIREPEEGNGEGHWV